jgi:HlyD family secretion protein
MRRTPFALGTIVLVGSVALGGYYVQRADAGPTLTTDMVTRGDIVDTVSSTATVQPVTTVEVGSQMSGTIEALFADYNSIVRKGEVLAKLDQSTFASAVDQAKASLASAEAEVERLRVARETADTALTRARELSARELLPAEDLQTAETDCGSAAAQLVGAQSRVVQARASVHSSEVDLAKTVITSPIDGVVIARNVDVGQTVAASFTAPTLFVIAADLSKMQLDANIDESDVGQVSTNQSVTFRVDAYPSETFRGRVAQVRLNAATLNNVVTYAAMIDAPNPDLKLKPGMTATVTIEVGRKAGVLRVPTAALRFKPDAATLARFANGSSPAPAKTPTVWVSSRGAISPVGVRIGANDATHTEILDGPLAEGAVVVTRSTTAAGNTAAPSTATNNPLMPGRPGLRTVR